jgi:hypothetical protein
MVLIPCSQLITVAQPATQPDSTDALPVAENVDYAQHFSRRFPSLRGARKGSHAPADADADADLDDAAWLESALGPDDDDEDPVKPVQGGLTRQFGAK